MPVKGLDHAREGLRVGGLFDCSEERIVGAHQLDERTAVVAVDLQLS